MKHENLESIKSELFQALSLDEKEYIEIVGQQEGGRRANIAGQPRTTSAPIGTSPAAGRTAIDELKAPAAAVEPRPAPRQARVQDDQERGKEDSTDET